ncbi:MAG: hypothetical protein QM784_12165 [Polyangiaceae bacterium]
MRRNRQGQGRTKGALRLSWGKGSSGLAVMLSTVALTSGTFACSFGASATSGVKNSSGTERNRTVTHEPCELDSSGADKVDANGDGKPDVTVVREGGKESCRAADLDFDGKVDLYAYQDASGRMRRQELDYDRDGNIDEIQLFKDGELTEKHRSTMMVKRLDTWETYSQGRLVKAERDSDGNGKIDQWWDYKTPDCPLIRSDIDGNGEPDPTSQVDFCSEASYKPPEQAAPTTAPMLQKDTQALPSELSNRPEGESESKSATPQSEGDSGKPGESKPAETEKKGK